MLEVNNLTKYFKNNCVLDGINFAVERGKIIGLLGPNGAGKTTTVRIITGIIPKNSGKIKLDNQLIDPASKAWKSKIGVMPETSNAYLDYTPLKNLLFLGKLHGLKTTLCKTRAIELLKEFGIYEKIDDKIKRLSKGQKQRLNFCMSMLHDPEFFFLDEPTSGLDIQSTNFLRKKILKLSKKGKTVFLTTHNLIEANKLCDEIFILNKGKIIERGTPDDLKKKFVPLSHIEFELSELPTNESIFNEVHLDYQVNPTTKKLTIFSKNPMEDFPKIQDQLLKVGLHPLKLEIFSASLEEVFLKILGSE